MRYQIPRPAPDSERESRLFRAPESPYARSYADSGHAQHLIERAVGAFLSRRDHVRVAVEGDGEAGVAHHLGDDLGVDAGI